MSDSSNKPLSQLFTFSGVAPDGSYLTPPATAEELVELAKVEREQTSKSKQKQIKNLSIAKSSAHLGFDSPLHDPEEAGWGVIVHEDLSDEIKKEIDKLVKHRADHYKIKPKIFSVSGEPGYLDFLVENSVSPGFGEVEKVPYYLLIAGDPTLIPFRFQYELSSEYAVGRLAFNDSDGYRDYIDQLIDYETVKPIPNSRRAVFWAPENLDDDATFLSSRLLIRPLHDELDSRIDFERELFVSNEQGSEASKANLAEILSRSKPPALLFTASHGLGYRIVDPEKQLRYQGALVTQEWGKGDPITASMIYSGEDIKNSASVRGMVHFAFACYGAGTPSHDDYSHGKSSLAPVIAPFPFVANLANQELIGGALGFIGHVDRAWDYSFRNPTGTSQNIGFERAIKNLLLEKRAWPIGHCLRDLYDRALHLAKSLLEDLNDMDLGKQIPPLEIAVKWKERNDARAYALIGDPAARVRVEDIK